MNVLDVLVDYLVAHPPAGDTPSVIPQSDPAARLLQYRFGKVYLYLRAGQGNVLCLVTLGRPTFCCELEDPTMLDQLVETIVRWDREMGPYPLGWRDRTIPGGTLPPE